MNHGSKIRCLPLWPLFEPKDGLAFLRFCRPSVSLEIFLGVWECAQECQSPELFDHSLFAPAKVSVSSQQCKPCVFPMGMPPTQSIVEHGTAYYRPKVLSNANLLRDAFRNFEN